MIKVLSAEFVTTATTLKQCPREPIAEVAFVGRSNVGKSSMINTLTNRKKLVRVSNTPGRTRTLNFFEVKLEARGRKPTVRLCDLPGYGFAKASKADRADWKGMIEGYLQGRDQLKVVVCIVDGEIGPSEEDAQMIEFLQETEARILVVATKIDRISKSQRKPRVHQVREQLGLPEGTVLGFSAVEHIGFDEVWGALLDATYARA